jgi:hypothetical protein
VARANRRLEELSKTLVCLGAEVVGAGDRFSAAPPWVAPAPAKKDPLNEGESQ